MSNIIDKTYFERDIALPLTSAAAQEKIEEYIEKYEREFLEMLLGNQVYAECVNASWSGSPYAGLLAGEDYSFEYGGDTYYHTWWGLQDTYFRSMVAYYVYFMFMRYNQDFMTPTGNVKGKALYDPHSANRKMVQAWNQMCEIYGLDQVDKMRSEDYEHYNGQNTAYNYILSIKDSFTAKWEFTSIKKVNEFNI